jgi:benzoate-CoA ligase
VPGYSAKLLDDGGTEVTEPDTPGYLHVRGPSIATGYWQREEATAAAFGGGWLRTGDVYVRSADDHWTFLGRNNDMIKAGGMWVSPAEVESVLVEHPDVLEAAVVGARNAAGLEETVAFVVPRSGATIDAGALDAHCRGRMAAFKRPRLVIEVAELPKTATGKIRRFALREQLARE